MDFLCDSFVWYVEPHNCIRPFGCQICLMQVLNVFLLLLDTDLCEIRKMFDGHVQHNARLGRASSVPFSIGPIGWLCERGHATNCR